MPMGMSISPVWKAETIPFIWDPITKWSVLPRTLRMSRVYWLAQMIARSARLISLTARSSISMKGIWKRLLALRPTRATTTYFSVVPVIGVSKYGTFGLAIMCFRIQQPDHCWLFNPFKRNCWWQAKLAWFIFLTFNEDWYVYVWMLLWVSIKIHSIVMNK